MLDLIAHRGPDGRGSVEVGAATLGHVRLSILDLSNRAAQPMMSQDGRYYLTYNGEVYNFRELRSRLHRIGIEPRSSGDTEVLLEHLVAFGWEDTLPRIEGFFAFGLWDSVDNVLTLARDRLGKKPLYWAVTSGQVRFASEAKALVAGSTLPDQTTVEAMLLGFSGSYGRRTAFQGIESLEPGSSVTFRDSCTPEHRQWFRLEDLVDPDLRADLARTPEPEVIERAIEAIDASLRYRMVSDVPVASLVSGGVDSSLVTILASESGTVPDLYHADVVGDSERDAAEMVARQVGQGLRVATVDDRAFVHEVAHATWFNDQPLTYHVNAVPFMKVCQRAGEDRVKVLLSGEGSDELFLGYPSLGLAPYLEAIDAMKSGTRRVAQRIAPRVISQTWPNIAESHNAMLRELISRAEARSLRTWAESSSGHLDRRNERRAHVTCLGLVRGHLTSLLHRNDRLGMAAGLENRFPLLGNNFVRLALNLPARFKLRWEPKVNDRRHPFITDKWLIRHVSSTKMSRELAMRSKQGFPVKVHDRLRVTPELLQDGFLSEHWGLNESGIHEVLDRATPVWALRLALVEVWGRLFFRRETAEEVTELLVRSTRVRT